MKNTAKSTLHKAPIGKAPKSPTTLQKPYSAPPREPLEPARVAELMRAAIAQREADGAADPVPPNLHRPAPRAVARFPEARREAARRIGHLAELAHSGGISGGGLLGGGGGGGGRGVSEGPQARVAWAIGVLRRIVWAIGPELVRLDAKGGAVRAVELVARVCVRDQTPATILRELGLKRSRGRAQALLDGLNAALGRVAEAEGLEVVARHSRKA